MSVAIARPYVETQAESVQTFARGSVADWSKLCQQFLDYRPKPEQVDEHLVTLKWLLRFARVMQVIADDPDYPDHQISTELKGRLTQLEYARLEYANPLSEAENDRIAQFFPQ